MAHELGGGTTCGTILKYNAGHAAKRMNPVSAAYCSKVKRHLAARILSDRAEASAGFFDCVLRREPLYTRCQPAGRPHPQEPKGCG